MNNRDLIIDHILERYSTTELIALRLMIGADFTNGEKVHYAWVRGRFLPFPKCVSLNGSKGRGFTHEQVSNIIDDVERVRSL